MVDHRPRYYITPGDLLDVEIVQADGGRVLVRGRIDAVPDTCSGHQALKIRLVASSIRPLCGPDPEVTLPPLRLVSSTDQNPTIPRRRIRDPHVETPRARSDRGR